MSLQDVQNLLARIFTNEDLRLRFLREPQKIGAENNLIDAEIEQIRQLLPEQINFFADSLFSKRLHEVGKLLPLTQKILGKDFEKKFREFANQFLPQTIKKHLEDALEFAEFLQSKEIEPVRAKDLAKFEQSRLMFYNSEKRFLLKRFDFDIREVLKEISSAGGKAQSDFPKRKTFAVWLRIGKRTKHFIY
ncbi:MAG TPA: hypothetical protein VK400_07920 [Pyrinomonadaceae bacterium]|nr:hypothetical protein [Pyrinomonadaceae bacterium]